MTATTIEIPAGCGLMSHLNPKDGDFRQMWDRGNPDEVAAARATFDRLVKDEKHLAYRAEGKAGERGERITRFDPDAERIIFVKQNKGG